MGTSATRRDLLKVSAAGAAMAISGCAGVRAAPMPISATSAVTPAARGSGSAVPKRRFGRATEEVSILGVGGSHLGETRDESEASGIDSIDVLRQNLAVARGFVPMPSEEMARLRARLAGAAADGRFEVPRVTSKGALGRTRRASTYIARHLRIPTPTIRVTN